MFVRFGSSRLLHFCLSSGGNEPRSVGSCEFQEFNLPQTLWEHCNILVDVIMKRPVTLTTHSGNKNATGNSIFFINIWNIGYEMRVGSDWMPWWPSAVNRCWWNSMSVVHNPVASVILYVFSHFWQLLIVQSIEKRGIVMW